MKLSYLYLLLILLLPGCIKIEDPLLLIDKNRLHGSWHVVAVTSIAALYDYSKLDFKKNDKFTFLESGKVEVTTSTNEKYTGTWWVDTDRIENANCFTSPYDGSTICNDDFNTTLSINTESSTTGQEKSVSFADIKFETEGDLVAAINTFPYIALTYRFKKD